MAWLLLEYLLSCIIETRLNSTVVFCTWKNVGHLLVKYLNFIK